VEQTPPDPSIVTHVVPDAQFTIHKYLDAFLGESPVVVVAPGRVADVCNTSAFAGSSITDCESRFEPLPPAPTDAPEDTLTLESSGTTGTPKLVRYRKSVIRDCAAAISASLELDGSRDYLSLPNPRLAYGLSIMHSHLLAGVPVRFVPAPSSLQAWAEFREMLRPDGAVYMTPHQSFLLTQDAGWRFDAPIELIFAGGPLRHEMVEQLTRAFPRATVSNMYGQAELGPRIARRRFPIADFEEGNVGEPLPGVLIRIESQDGSDSHGAIEVDSRYRMECYVTSDGVPVEREVSTQWWPTGDVGHVSADGDLVVAGRAAADINFLGTRIPLAHLRTAVRDVPEVLDTRVSSAAHPVYGQRPAMRVLVRSLSGSTDDIERSVRKALAANIGSAASAVLIEFVDPGSLPASGKL
jgi:acyl-coenzyme A synthetase/AMP-(fatty) acid ligase